SAKLRSSPSARSRCSGSIVRLPNLLASYRAKKITLLALSVYRSNMSHCLENCGHTEIQLGFSKYCLTTVKSIAILTITVRRSSSDWPGGGRITADLGD